MDDTERLLKEIRSRLEPLVVPVQQLSYAAGRRLGNRSEDWRNRR